MKLRLALQKVGPLMSPQPSDIFVVTDDCVVIIVIVIYKKIGQHCEYFVTYTTGVYYRCPWVGLDCVTQNGPMDNSAIAPCY